MTQRSDSANSADMEQIRELEDRITNCESLLGIILACPDPRIQRLLFNISEDPFIKQILAEVNTSYWGPEGRMRDGSSFDAQHASSIYDPSNNYTNPYVVGPNRTWQDHVLARIQKALADATPQASAGPSQSKETVPKKGKS